MATKETIPMDGSSEAFGYGVATGDSIIVTTTHKGVLGNAAQNAIQTIQSSMIIMPI